MKKQPFYKNRNSYLICGLVGIVGIIYLILAVVTNSVRTVIKLDETGYDGMGILTSIKRGLLELRYGLSFGRIAPTLLLLLLILFLLIMLYFVIKDNFLNKNFVKEKERVTLSDKLERQDNFIGAFLRFTSRHKNLSRLLIVVPIIVIFVLFRKTLCYRESYDLVTALAVSWKSIIEEYEAMGSPTNMVAEIHIGAAWIFQWAGLVFYVASYCFNYVLDTLNE